MVQFVFYKLNFASKEVLVAHETFSDRLRQAMSDRDVRQSDVIRASEMLGKKARQESDEPICERQDDPAARCG